MQAQSQDIQEIVNQEHISGNASYHESIIVTDNPHSGHDPMHQFEIHTIKGLEFNIAGFDISITNSTLTMFGVTFLLITLLSFLVSKLQIIPGKRQSTAEIVYNFVKSLVTGNISHGGMKFMPFVFALFLFIFASNAFGLLPYAFTVTSHIAVTGTFAILVFLLSVILGIFKKGPIGFFTALVPAGVPKFFAPLIFIIEFFTYLARPITLAIRLAVNMVAGHTMMKVIAGFVASMGALGLIPVFFNSALVGFELFVAGLQAYIFSMLTCVYINDAISHH